MQFPEAFLRLELFPPFPTGIRLHPKQTKFSSLVPQINLLEFWRF
nr:MAG TPA: hypothetical protein [Caudoviricetes sp.]